VVIDSLVGQQVPIVRVVDNFFRNKKMATILDFKIDTGKLILCSMDIHSNLQERPVVRKHTLLARQILYTELQYHVPVVNSYVKFKTIAVYGRDMSLILVT
jgi:hypothetical protein